MRLWGSWGSHFMEEVFAKKLYGDSVNVFVVLRRAFRPFFSWFKRLEFCMIEGMWCTTRSDMNTRRDVRTKDSAWSIRLSNLRRMILMGVNSVVLVLPFVIRIYLFCSLLFVSNHGNSCTDIRKYSLGASIAGPNIEKKKETPPAKEETVQHQTSK